VRFYLYESRKAIWSQRIALISFLVFVAVVLMHRFWTLPTPLAMKIFGLCVAGAVAALVLGVAALVTIWREGYIGAGRALVGSLFSILLLALPLWSLPSVVTLPRIHDISTDVAAPPAFAKLAALRSGQANAPQYQPGLAALQIVAYPDIQPVSLPRPPAEIYTTVQETVRGLNWRIVAATPPGENKPGLIEAVDRSLIFGFTDDVVIRVTPEDKETRVDIRSSSRFGEHDLGRNAERIRTFFSDMRTKVAQLDQTERMARVMAEREARARQKAQEDERRARQERRAARAAEAQALSPSSETRSPALEGSAQTGQGPSQSSARVERRQLRQQRQRERTRAARRFWEELGQ
jgi:uncharacterized protein (DUF1499 family)